MSRPLLVFIPIYCTPYINALFIQHLLNHNKGKFSASAKDCAEIRFSTQLNFRCMGWWTAFLLSLLKGLPHACKFVLKTLSFIYFLTKIFLMSNQTFFLFGLFNSGRRVTVTRKRSLINQSTMKINQFQVIYNIKKHYISRHTATCIAWMRKNN
jgi:hypothetical protein